MTKVEFLKRWAKKATAGGAVEGFEVDLEKLMRSTVRCTTSAIVNGLLAGIGTVSKRDQERFRQLFKQVSPCVEKALEKLY